MDRPKNQVIKLELWMEVGLASLKKGTPEYKENFEIKESISDNLWDLLNPVSEISKWGIVFKDHYSANKA